MEGEGSMGEQLVETVTTRHNHGIDPVLHVWGWEIPVYLFLGGLAAGLMILGATLELVRGTRPESKSIRLMPFAALALLSLGMVALFLDLEYKAHVFRFYTTFQVSSPMSWGSWILLLVYPAALLAGIGGLATTAASGGWWQGLVRFADAYRRPILWTSIVVGAALGIYTGLLLGTLNARPLWNSIIMGPLFLCSGISTGAAFMLLFNVRRPEHELLVRWDLIAIGAELVCIALLLLDLAAGTRAARLAAGELLGGPWTGVFWALVVGAGLLVPLGMEWIELRRHQRPTVLAPILILVGGFALRYILVAAGQAVSYGSF
jgi:formate-dependent nitrite reductase membrane component NrfD